MVMISTIYGCYRFYQEKKEEKQLQRMQNQVNEQSKRKIDDELSVIAIGNSNLYSGFNPLQLWHEYKITSFVAAEPSQDPNRAYYILKNVLEFQHPQLIIWEMDEMFTGKDFNDEKAQKYAPMNLFPIARNYTNWNKYSAQSFKNYDNYDYNYLSRMATKGYLYKRKVKARKQNKNFMIKTIKRANIKPHRQEIFYKIVSLLKEKQIPLLLITIPSARSWTMEKHNTIMDLSKEVGVPFLDLNLNNQLINWKKDTRDEGMHLNDYGAQKVTAYIGEYLKEHNLIENQTISQESQKMWDQDYYDYIEMIN